MTSCSKSTTILPVGRVGGVLCRRPYMSRMLWSGGARQENEDLPLRGIERELIDGRGRSRSTPGTGAGQRRRISRPSRGQFAVKLSPPREVCPMAGMRGKCDPSRGGGRGRRVDGRGGRDVLPDCADDGRWRPEQTGADRPTGTAACSRHDRGHTPRRRRRDGCTDGRLSGGGAGPRRRSARGDLRLDNGPEPWHNSSDRLGLSELGAVTRVRLGYNRALTPRLSPLSTLTRTQRWRPAPGPWTPSLPMDAKSAPTGSLLCAVRDYAESVEDVLSSTCQDEGYLI